MSTMQNRRILLVDDSPTIHADFRKILAPDQSGSSDVSLTATWQRTRELEQSNALLARRAHEMRSAVDHMTDAVITFDQDGRIRAANPTAETMFGYALNDIVGSSVSMLVPVLAELAVASGATGSAVPCDGHHVQGVRREGAVIELEVSVNSYTLEGRQLRTAILRDIGERLSGLLDHDRHELAPMAGFESRPAPLPLRTSVIEAGPMPVSARLGGILVAEDNRINQQVILTQLKLLGFQAEVADNGLEALARWREGGFALIMTDLQMPEMDGFELAASVRLEEGAGRRVPILALTANALGGESERCLAIGMDGYLTKPLQVANLQAALERWLGSDGAVAAPPLLTPVAPPDDARRADAEAVDPSVLPRLVGDDPAVLREFFVEFAQDMSEAEAELRAAALGPRASLGSLAHRLKGAARSVGALRLGDLCAETEAAAQGSDAAAVASSLPPLFAEVATVRDWVRAHYADA